MSAPSNEAISSHLQDMVQSYMRSHGRSLPVSVARLSRLARAEMPGLALSDNTLSQLIGREAVRAGHIVHFDGKDSWPQFNLEIFG